MATGSERLAAAAPTPTLERGNSEPRELERLLGRGDATALDFPDGAFDLVYSYHALEHIPDFRRALREMARVLADDGRYFVGTPNRHRLVGYIGSQNTPLRKKILWNANDWSARLRGRFRNEYGAHAGFTRAELQEELSAAIGPATNVTLPYYLCRYARNAGHVRLLERTRLSRVLFPAIYFMGRKRPRSALAPVASRDEIAAPVDTAERLPSRIGSAPPKYRRR